MVSDFLIYVSVHVLKHVSWVDVPSSKRTCKTCHHVMALTQVSEANKAMLAMFYDHFKVFLVRSSVVSVS